MLLVKFNCMLIDVYFNYFIVAKTIEVYTDCTDYFRDGFRLDGVFEVQPVKEKRFNVYCNMTAGGWTALMRRDLNVNKVDFYHDLATYKHGFGDLLSEHFLG